MSLVFIYTGFLIIFFGAISLFMLFLWQKNHLLKKRPFFWHWMCGFALYALVHTPVVILNVVYSNSSAQITVYYFIAFFAFLGSSLLFYRGTLPFLNRFSNFWLNEFPAIWLLPFAVIIPVLYLGQGINLAIASTIFIFGVLIPLAIFILVTFLRLYLSGKCFVDHRRRSFMPLLISLGWLSILVLDIIMLWFIWQSQLDIVTLSVQLVHLQNWYLGRAISIIITFIGVALLHRHLPHLRDINSNK